MHLEILSTRTGGAAENMAIDFLLLQRYPAARAMLPRFRHYDWRAPAFTFGYAQKIAAVRAALAPVKPPFELCRRATGGGIVDHREDWTYALVIPRGHPLEELRATQSYREIHAALAAALRAQGVDTALVVSAGSPAQEGRDDSAAIPALPSSATADVCFTRAEIHDVVHVRSGAKIAGAAQKRNKHGLLFQGSIWRPATGAVVDWDVFHDDFAARLALALGMEAQETPWPDLNEDEVSGLVEQYSSPEWIEFR